MKKIRTLEVLENRQLTRNMRRIRLGGEALADFPVDRESGYVKVMFDRQTEAPIRALDALPADRGAKPIMRSYTIRAFDPARLTLDLDFVVHGDNGPASRWAMHVEAGDWITVSGPGPTKLVDTTADWFLLAGDMSALPAISVNLEKMPRSARGHAVVEVLCEEDKQALAHPPGVSLHWVINPHAEEPNAMLADQVKKLPWQPGRPYVWVASEFDAMQKIRTYLRDQRGCDRSNMYASSYWKIGETDEGNKAAKRRDLAA